MSHWLRRVAPLVAAWSLLYGQAGAQSTDAPAAGASPGAHLALILPLQSPALGKLAEVVRQGFVAAARVQPPQRLAIVVYATGDAPAESVAAYQKAVAQSAAVVVGPLTRNAVSALADTALAVPVLALNLPEDGARLPERLHSFSLQVEAEARQVAKLAFEQGRRSALTVADGGALSRRILKAFLDEFVRLGGRQQVDFVFSASPTGLSALREAAAGGQADAVFLALDAARARVVRPHLESQRFIYATSQVFDGREEPLKNLDLEGVRFVDMPWMVQPDHPAVMTFQRTDARTGADSERLYAFGVDAYRLALDLAGAQSLAREPIDGVTGRIQLGADRYYGRELVPMQFHDGRVGPVVERFEERIGPLPPGAAEGAPGAPPRQARP